MIYFFIHFVNIEKEIYVKEKELFDLFDTNSPLSYFTLNTTP